MSSSKTSGPRLSQPISALPYARLKGLANRLDMPCDGNQLYWRRMIEVMPEGMYDPLTVNRFAMNAGALQISLTAAAQATLYSQTWAIVE